MGGSGRGTGGEEASSVVVGPTCRVSLWLAEMGRVGRAGPPEVECRVCSGMCKIKTPLGMQVEASRGGEDTPTSSSHLWAHW